jgi:hypothetical protein
MMNILNQFADPLDVIIHILFMLSYPYITELFFIHYLHNQARITSPVKALRIRLGSWLSPKSPSK